MREAPLLLDNYTRRRVLMSDHADIAARSATLEEWIEKPA